MLFTRNAALGGAKRNIRTRAAAPIDPGFFNKYLNIMCPAFPIDTCIENLNNRPFPSYENQEAVLETFYKTVEAASAIPPPSINAAALELIIRGDTERLDNLMSAFETMHGILENLDLLN